MLAVLEVSVRDQLTLLPLALWQGSTTWQKCVAEHTVYLMAQNEGEGRKARVPMSPLRHVPSDLKPPQRPHILMGLPSPRRASLGASFGDVQIQTVADAK